jgi:hypothetical protein
VAAPAGLPPSKAPAPPTRPPPGTLQSLLREVRMAAGRILLFIDELHLLMDAGRVEGGMNAGAHGGGGGGRVVGGTVGARGGARASRGLAWRVNVWCLVC